jgi:branched-chain amino acid transport system substrate-binding protein
MRKMMTAAALAAGMALVAAPAAAEVKVGMMLTLSGPPAVLGQHARDGFQLAVKELGGKLGGEDAEVIVVDDELKPDVAVDRVKALIERDDIDVFVGVIFSNVMMAVYKPLIEAEVVTISPNAGPSPIAGAQCSPYFFSTSWQNDQNHEVMGQYAQDQGYERVIVMAPNYQAGKDSVAGFKRYFKGEIADEIYTQLGQLDFSAELARIAAAQPDAIFTFMPGGMGVNLVKQYRQAGLADTIPFLSAFTVDETTLPATQDDAVGLLAGANWAPDLDAPGNAAFVSAFEAEYGYVPALYAAQGYDAAKLLDAAIKEAGGVGDNAALIDALAKADFQSVRGDFSFNTNHMPIENFYLVEAVKRDDGSYATSVKETVFENHGDAYADQCSMN